MDDLTLVGLEAALAESPKNAALLRVYLQGCLAAGQPERALPRLRDVPQDDAGLRLECAKLAVAAKDAALALALVPEAGPEADLTRARALLLAGRRPEGLEAYRRAVDASPALEDPGLEDQLRARAREVVLAGGPRLTVLSNDDTSASDAGRVVQAPAAPITFADVGGLDDVKAQIHKRIVLPFQKPSLFARFKRKSGGGILLYGPPGCGKTLLARATAGECKAAFFAVAISDILDMYIGESERKLHALFEKARATAPAVLFFDELEALAGKRQFSREATSAKLVSQFLSEMDGFAQANAGVLLLGATNVPWAVDPAFRRPGRFERVQFIPPPDAKARAAILTLHLAQRPVAQRLDVERIAARTSGCSGADLAHLVETAADAAIARALSNAPDTVIEQRDLEAATEELKPTAQEWLTTARNHARYANESGQYDDVLAWLDAHGSR